MAFFDTPPSKSNGFPKIVKFFEKFENLKHMRKENRFTKKSKSRLNEKNRHKKKFKKREKIKKVEDSTTAKP